MPEERDLYIQRVQVDGGFLEGLDLKLVPGLNVVFGARGTGKTSLIELIRFALGAKGYTAESAKRAGEHARSVLGDGEVTVTLQGETGAFTVSRSAREDRPRTDRTLLAPVIFSQSEVESVGLHASGRLRLIDGFLRGRKKALEHEDELSAQARSTTAEAASLMREIAQLEEQLKELPAVEKAFAEAQEAARASAKGSAAIAAKSKSLEKLSAEIARNSVASGFLDRFLNVVSTWCTPLVKLDRVGPRPEPWDDAEGPDPLAQLRRKFELASGKVGDALTDLQALQESANERLAELTSARLKLDEQVRGLRKEIEGLEKGAGEAAKKSAALHERKAQLDSIQKLHTERRKKLARLQSARGEVLDELDSIRESRFEHRAEVAQKLSVSLGPRLRLSVLRSGLYEEYGRQIADGLRGSGLRYTELAAQLSAAMSPRELLEAAESDNVALVAEVVSIAVDRAGRILAQLREHGLSEISTCLVEDAVKFELLDGTDYKDVADLSTGQRCTVVLPVLLAHDDRVVIVDQPEDHIDNAFIADTIIKAIRAKRSEPQIIFSTHNANIPVLGGAARVVQMGSDGKRGFVVLSRELDHPDAVKAITDVMEGGRKAFETRAKFYLRHTK